MAVEIPQSIKQYFAKISDYHEQEAHDVNGGLKQATVDRPGLQAGAGDPVVTASGADDLAKAASWIFGMIKDAGAALYKCISQGGSNEDQAQLEQDKAEIAQFRAQLDALGNDNDNKKFHHDLTQIIDKHIEHLEEKSTRTRNITLLSGAGIACAAAGAVAGLFVIKWLFTAAVVIGLGIAALSIYNYVKNPDKPGDVKNFLDIFEHKDRMV